MISRPNGPPADNPDPPTDPYTFRCRSCDHRFETSGGTNDWSRCPNCDLFTAIAWERQGRRVNTMYWQEPW